MLTSLYLYLQLFETRSKYVLPEEMALWSDVTQELMSDEEDNGDILKVKTPHWRCGELNQLIKSLDQRSKSKMEASGRQILKKGRVVAESPMKRLPSKRLKQELIRHDNEDDNGYDNEQ